MSIAKSNKGRTWQARPWKQQLLINGISLLSMFYLLMVVMNSVLGLINTGDLTFTIRPSEVVNNIFRTEYRELWSIGCFLIAIIFGINLLNQKQRHDMLGTGQSDRLDNTKKGSTRWLRQDELEKDEQMGFFYPKDKPNPPPVPDISNGKKIKVDKARRGGVAINYDFEQDKYFLQSEGNNMIIGPTRSGKTQTIVFPSIMACANAGENIIVTDPKLEIYRTTGKYLEECGYKFLIINFKNPEFSDNWNPLTWVYQQAKYARGHNDWKTGEWVEGHHQWDKFTQARDDLCMTLIVEANEKNKFFSDSARDILKAAITVCIKLHLDNQNQIYSLNEQVSKKETELAQSLSNIEEVQSQKLIDALQKHIDNYKNADFDRQQQELINFFSKEEIQNINGVVEYSQLYTDIFKLKEKISGYSAELTLSNISLVLKQYADVPAKGEKSQWDEYITSLADSNDKMDAIAFSVKSTASGDTLSNVMATLNSSISTFVTDEGVKRITSTSSFSFEEFNTQKTAVFLAIPDETESRHVFGSLFIAQSYKAFVDVCNNNDLKGIEARMAIPVRYFLDEFANMPIIPKFGNCLTVCLGRQIYFNIFIQSLGQLKTAYERDFATIKDNVNWLIIGVADNETAKEVSEKLGSYTTTSTSASVGKGDDSYSLGIDSRQLLTPDELMNQMIPGQLIVTRLRSLPWTTKLPYHWQMTLPGKEVWWSAGGQLNTLPENDVKEYKFHFSQKLYDGFIKNSLREADSIKKSIHMDDAQKTEALNEMWQKFMSSHQTYEQDINIDLVFGFSKPENDKYYAKHFKWPETPRVPNRSNSKMIGERKNHSGNATQSPKKTEIVATKTVGSSLNAGEMNQKIETTTLLENKAFKSKTRTLDENFEESDGITYTKVEDPGAGVSEEEDFKLTAETIMQLENDNSIKFINDHNGNDNLDQTNSSDEDTIEPYQRNKNGLKGK